MAASSLKAVIYTKDPTRPTAAMIDAEPQLKACRQCCQHKGLEVVGDYTDLADASEQFGRLMTVNPPQHPRRRRNTKTMNKLTVNLEVGDQRGNRFQRIQIIVDAGSTFTALPRAFLEEISVPVDRQANSRLADGRTVPIDLGWTMVRLQGQTSPTQVIFAEDGEPSLLGMVTLGEALLAVDPEAQRLVPVDADHL